MKNHIKAYGLIPYLKTKNGIRVLLCKGVSSKEKWGCLKGVKLKNEDPYLCAQRETFEECGIYFHTEIFEDYFEQINYEKDIGIWTVNIENIEDFDKYFINNTLKSNYLSWENSSVKFFNIKELPPLKKKQKKLINEIKDSLKSKIQFH
ncbi:MAG: NUDIX domain-containing protein [Sulfurovum sp.]|jgi:predicted NUDIX family NTP pyrophosphohydrolase|nr:MAG: Uncharacterised protein [Arcobacter lacus]